MPEVERLLAERVEEIVVRFTRQVYYDQPNTFQAEVRRPPIPLSGGSFRLQVEEEIETFRAHFAARLALVQVFTPAEGISPDLATGEEALRELGDALHALLPETLREDFRRLVQYTLTRDCTIRLVLEARAGDHADRLLGLPWEILFQQETLAYLARSPRLRIVRRLLDAPRQGPGALPSSYRVLHVVADAPGSAAERAFHQLAQVEGTMLREVLGPMRYTRVAAPGSIERVEEALGQGAYQVLHFLGHGQTVAGERPNGPRGDVQRTYLLFESGAGLPQLVTGENLRLRLATTEIQLVVLNACQGGATAAGNAALELVYSGIPYVVAMQGEITMQAASIFTRSFYHALQGGHGMDEAVAHARARLAAELPGTVDWCLPVLYTNVGLPSPTPMTDWADRFWGFLGSSGSGFVMRMHGGGGLLFLYLGLLLALSGAQMVVVDRGFLTLVIGALLPAPPLVAGIVYRSGALRTVTQGPQAMRRALGLTVLAGATVGLGIVVLYAFWGGLLLALGVGLWGQLAPGARLLLLLPALLLALLSSYTQARGHGRAFLTQAAVEPPLPDGRLLLMVLAGYGMMVAPLALLFMRPALFGQPRGMMAVGLFLLLLGYIFWVETRQSRKPPWERGSSWG